jgi:hypothetical protein
MILHGLYLRGLPPKAYSYRKKYQQLIARIDSCVTKLNSLGNLAPNVKDPKVLDEFEACLRMSDSLISALVKIPPFGFKPELIGLIQPLVIKTESKIESAYVRFKLAIEGKPIFGPLMERWRKDTDVPAKGCYFCSRPFMKEYFKPASLKVDGIQLRVFGCQTCVTELRVNKKVKVLYFIEYGQPVHWALVESYRPSEQYWNLNRRRSSQLTKNFELVSEN